MYKSKEDEKAYQRAWYLKNKAAHKKRAKQWKKDNPDRVRAQNLAWKKANPEKVKIRARKDSAQRRLNKINREHDARMASKGLPYCVMEI